MIMDPNKDKQIELKDDMLGSTVREYMQDLKLTMCAEATSRTIFSLLRPFVKRVRGRNIDDINNLTKYQLHEIILELGGTKDAIYKAAQNLKHYFNWLKRNKYITVNLMDDISLPKVNRDTLPVVLTPTQLENLCIFVENHKTISIKNKTMFFVVRDTGIRVNELMRIQISHINFEEETIYIPTTKTGVSKLVCFTELTKGYIRDYIKKYKSKHYLFDKCYNPSRKLMSNYMPFYRAFAKIYDLWDPNWQGFKGPHSLRHAYATDFIAKTHNVKGLQWMMGWSNSAMSDRYVHQNPALIKDMYNKYRNGEKVNQ